MALHYQKLKDAIHYICHKASESSKDLDPIKLNKVLWYSDAMAYLQLGDSITGERYIRKPYGPVARRNRLAVAALSDAGAVMTGKSTGEGGYWNTHFDLLEEPDKDSLDEDARIIIDRVFDAVVGENTSMQISDRSHGEIWRLARNDEDLPLYTIFAEKLGPLTNAHFDWAREGAR